MDRDKRIEEMVCKKCLHYEGCLKRFMEAKQALGMYSSTTEEEYFAHADDCDMFITGYRKASDVAREIFEEIDKRFEALLKFYPCNGEFEDAKRFVDFHWKHIRYSIMCDYDAELKKKYTEDGK